MSRTQDLVLARLRLIAMRWQGGLDAGTGAPGMAIGAGGLPDPVGSGESGTYEGGAAADSDVEGDADGEEGQWSAGPDRGSGSAAQRPDAPDPDPPAWPAPAMWVRLTALLAVIVAIGGAAVLLTSWPREQRPETPAAPIATGSADPFADPFQAASPSPSPPVTVHVVGEVRKPGVVQLPAGSRVVDAVKAAGGLRRGGELGGTNLARVLTDGERIEIGGQDAAAGAGTGGPTGGSAGPLDLNSATAEQLDALPGVGPVTAAKILAWRSTHDRFSVVDELAEVPGIGPKTLADLRPLVRV